METSYLDIDLHLEEIKHLFVDPELNPFAYQRLQISGAEEAANYLRTKKRKVDRIRLTIFLPSEQIEPDLQTGQQMLYPGIVILKYRRTTASLR